MKEQDPIVVAYNTMQLELYKIRVLIDDCKRIEQTLLDSMNELNVPKDLLKPPKAEYQK